MKYFLICLAFLLIACNNPVSQTGEIAEPIAQAEMRLIGRFEKIAEGEYSFTWPGSALEFRFEGTSAKLKMASTRRVRFELDIDGMKNDLWVESGEAIYNLASDLTPGVHQIRLTRIIESFEIVTRVIGNPIVDKLLPAPIAPTKKLLVIGDSITAGYGVEGATKECHYAMETSNQQLSYAAVAAKHLNADLHAIAWSGIGAWRSYGEKTPVNPNILIRSQRTLADEVNSLWDTSKYIPDAILINIGTNDYWEGSAGDEYRQQMIRLIDRTQKEYPAKTIYLILSPMLYGAGRESQQTVLSSLTNSTVKLLDLGKIEESDGYGCDYHPNKVTNNRMAETLIKQLKTDLAW